MRPETVMIEGPNGPVMINKTDYNPQEHKLAEGMPEILRQTTALTPAAPVGYDANGNPVNQGDGGQFVPAQLRQDGPTVDEYVAAGYQASGYPPEGYASRSTQEQIDAAIAAQAAPPADPDAGSGSDADKQQQNGENNPPPVLLVTKNEKKRFIVVDMEQKPFVAEGIEADGYKTEKEAWEAVTAYNANLAGQTA